MCNQESLVDPYKWKDLVDSLDTDLPEIVESFLEDTPVRIGEMQAALAQGNLDLVHQIAHSLKSSVAIFGAQRLKNLCQNIEQETGGSSSSENQMQQIVVAFDELRVELENRIAEQFKKD